MASSSVLWTLVVIGLMSPLAAADVGFPLHRRSMSSSSFSSSLALVDGENFTTSELVSLACLQGTLAQAQAVLYLLPPSSSLLVREPVGYHRLSVTPGSSRACYKLYLAAIVKAHNVTVLDVSEQLPKTKNGTFGKAIGFIRQLVTNLWANTTNAGAASWGYVHANGSSPESVAVGVMMCAQQGPGCLLASTASEVAELEAIGIGKIETSVGKTIRQYLMVDDGVRMSSNEIAVLQDPTKFPALVDVVAATQGVVWFDALNDLDISLSVLGHLAPPSVVMGWGVDELHTVEMLSTFASGILAADWAWNTATLSSYPMLSLLPPPDDVFAASSVSEKSLPRAAAVDNRHVVSFVTTDGDNVQWLLNGFLESTWYGSPARGKCPITWTISPSLAWISPSTFSIITSTATPNDTFITSVSGYSYSYPSLIPALQLAASVNTTFEAMQSAGLEMLNVLDQPTGVAAAEDVAANFFSTPTGISPVSTVLYYPYSFYCALNGSMRVWQTHPKERQLFASGRFCLWSPQFYNVSTLVTELQKQPQDPTIPAGYSIVPVNVWSHGVEDVWSVVQQLDPARFRVVGLEELSSIAKDRLVESE